MKAKRKRIEGIGPTPESARHGGIEAVTLAVDGRPVRAHRRVWLIERMARAGKLIPSQLNAATQYRDTWHRAHAGELKAVDLGAVRAGSGLPWAESQERAKAAVRAWNVRLEGLSPGMVARVEATVCLDAGVRDWGAAAGFGQRDRCEAAGLAELRIALNVLAAVMGY